MSYVSLIELDIVGQSRDGEDKFMTQSFCDQMVFHDSPGLFM